MELMKMPPAERNAAFAEMPPRQKAVEVAKDVLVQLDLKLYRATIGTYFEFLNPFIDPDEEDSLQVVLETERCNLCAIGGAFASMARLRNNVTIREALDLSSGFMVRSMRDIFTDRTLRAMEVVFEQFNAGQNDWHRDEQAALLDYGRTLREQVPGADLAALDEHVMRSIMQNVIDNDGEFIVSGIKLTTPDTY